MINTFIKLANNLDKQNKYIDADKIDIQLIKLAHEFPAIGIYAFMGWLSGREKILKVGASENCAVLADLINEFCKSQKWKITDENWHNKLKDYPV